MSDRLDKVQKLAAALGISAREGRDVSQQDFGAYGAKGNAFIKDTGLTPEQVDSLIDDYLVPIRDSVAPNKKRDFSFGVGKDVDVHVPDLQPNSLRVIIAAPDKFDKFIDFLNSHQKETKRAVEDIKSGKIPTLPNLPVVDEVTPKKSPLDIRNMTDGSGSLGHDKRLANLAKQFQNDSGKNINFAWNKAAVTEDKSPRVSGGSVPAQQTQIT